MKIMKRLLLLVGILFSINCEGQDSLLYQIFPVVGTKVLYEKVIELPGQSKDTLFLKAKIWALGAFNSQKAAFETEDKIGGLIGYRTFFATPFTSPPLNGISATSKWEYWTSVRIYLKDNKVKIVVENENLTINTDVINTPVSASYSLFDYKKIVENTYSGKMEKLVGKDYRHRYWDASISNFKLANDKYKKLITSLESALSGKNSEANF
jgi:hypothetical protein